MRSGSTPSPTPSASATGSTTNPTSSPAGNNSGWRSRGHSPPSPTSSSPMNPRETRLPYRCGGALPPAIVGGGTGVDEHFGTPAFGPRPPPPRGPPDSPPGVGGT